MKGHYCTVQRITEKVVQRNGTIEKRRLVTYGCNTHDLLASNEVDGMIESTRNVPAYANALAHFGEANSRTFIATPALLCDVALLVSNIEGMADEARASDVSLRPHLKSHKSAFILELQLKAGACGVACAKLGEAEAIIEARGKGAAVLSVLLTSPLVGHHAALRAVTLAARCDLIAVVDHVDGVDELAHALVDTNATIAVLCDVDVGLGRTGVTTPTDALLVAERVGQFPQLVFSGVQGYGGHLQHIAGREHRRTQTTAAMKRLQSVIDALESNGHDVSVRTGGGTGTSSIDIELGVLNELQPGSYVFMDREYRDALGDDREGRFQQSLTILTSVISANHEGFVTVDAGLKSMATDAGPAAVVGNEEATFAFFGDEQGMVTNGAGPAFRRGERLELVPPHCDPTIDKYDVIWLVHDDVVVDVIDVTARGRSQ
jgi:D-serine deaminase-like pyridoxal phosphate-dependent protein